MRFTDKIDNVKFYDIYKVGKYFDSQSRERDMYYMNRDGFTLLVMSYTGQKAKEMTAWLNENGWNIKEKHGS